MEKSSFRQLPVVEVYNSASSCASTNRSIVSLGVRIPCKKTYTTNGFPVLAIYKGDKLARAVYLLVIKDPQGNLFDRFYYEPDMLHVSDENFSLSKNELKEVEKFLANGQR